MSMKRFVVTAIAAILLVFVSQSASDPVQEVQAAMNNIRSNGRIIYNNNGTDNRGGDVVLFDADDIKMLGDKLKQLETRIQQLRNR